MSVKDLSIDNLFDSLISEGLNSTRNSTEISIINFTNEFIFNGKNKLYPTQEALLKSFYGEQLTESDILILKQWYAQEKTTWKEGRKYKNLVLNIGRRGTKTTLVSIINLFEFYKLVSLDSPAEYYGLLPNSPIALFVISQSQDQVKETLFAQIKGYAEESIYFKNLEKSGKIEILQQEIRCPSKNIMLAAKHTNSRSLVGYSIICLTLDEAARFEYDDMGKSKADNIWSNVGKGVSTFGNAGKKIAISSAWEEGDYIEKLYNLSKRDTKTLGFMLKTWDVNLNPNMSEAVIKSSEDYITDPIAAALEYENIRSSAKGKFFDKEIVARSFTGESSADIVEYPLDVTNDKADTRYYVACNTLRAEPIHSSISFAHLDYGIKKDRAALAFASPIKLENTWAIAIDILAGWKPYIDKDKNNKAINRVVSFLNVEEVLLNLCRIRKVNTVSFDCFNSQHTIQSLHNKGITTVEMSVSTKMQLQYYTLTKNLLNEGRLILPADSNLSTTLQAELCGLIQNPFTGKIDHTKNSTKDLADAVVNAVYNCNQYMITNNYAVENNGVKVTSIQANSNINNSKKDNQIIKAKSGRSKLYKIKKVF